MLALLRASLTAALLIVSSISASCRRQALSPRRPRRSRHPPGRPDQGRRRDGGEAVGGAAPRCRRGVRAQRPEGRHAGARSDRGGRPRRHRELAAALAHHPADAAGRRPRARHASRARRDRRLHRLSAHRRTRGEEADALVLLGRSYADRTLWRPALDALRLSLELREVADVRAPIRKDARRSRLPAARLHGRFGFRLAARVLPVLRAAAGQAHRPLALRQPGRPGQAGAVGGRQAALRRRPQARRALRHHGARRPAVDGEGDAGASPRTFRSMCATAARSSRFTTKAYVLPRTGQRGIPVVSVNTPSVAVKVYRIGDRNLLETVVGEDFQRSLSRYELDRLADERGFSGVERAARGRKPAQRRGDDGFPGRRGGRQSEPRRLRDVGGGRGAEERRL